MRLIILIEQHNVLSPCWTELGMNAVDSKRRGAVILIQQDTQFHLASRKGLALD